MKDYRYLSADIDPAQSTNVSRLKTQALALVRRELTSDPNLHDDAEIAILNDYDGIGAEELLKRICTFCQLLDRLEKKDAWQEMVSLLASLLRIGIYKVSGEALDVVTIRRDGIQVDIGSKSTLLGTMNSELLTILSLAKESRMTEQQLAMVETLIKEHSHETLQAVSDIFKIPVKDTERITVLIQNLFGERKNFIRKAFEVTLSELTCYGNGVFALSWCISKVLEGRVNRVAFLNAMQHLISRMRRPKHALRFLLADFCRSPDSVHFSDRNAIMLANILLRTYNKELDVDIEMTPEEVLNVRKGLDKDVVNYAQFRIDTVETRFAAKVRTIHEKLIALLEYPTPVKEKLTIRHLLLLEREIFIFLSLLSGKTAHLILVSALNEYGHPNTGIYRHARATTYLPVFLQQLKIIARGVGRIGTRDDIALLKKIRYHGLQLAELYGSRENQGAMTRTIQGIDNAMRTISMAGGYST
jgi:transcriptional regulator with XRE-family HTH domain